MLLAFGLRPHLLPGWRMAGVGYCHRRRQGLGHPLLGGGHETPRQQAGGVAGAGGVALATMGGERPLLGHLHLQLPPPVEARAYAASAVRPRYEGVLRVGLRGLRADGRGRPPVRPHGDGQPPRGVQHRPDVRVRLLGRVERGNAAPHAVAHAEREAHEFSLHPLRVVDGLRLPERPAADLERVLADPGEDPEWAHRRGELPGLVAGERGVRVADRLLQRGPDAARLALLRLDPGAAPTRQLLRPRRRAHRLVLVDRALARLGVVRALRVAGLHHPEGPAPPPLAPAPHGRVRRRGTSLGGILLPRRRDCSRLTRRRSRPLDEVLRPARSRSGRHRRGAVHPRGAGRCPRQCALARRCSAAEAHAAAHTARHQAAQLHVWRDAAAGAA
mmetsp:Transcript_18264/g.51696  ORF Transcript_18264/g.51696 Transcript_18264/m.51696 type:complete len:388 (+) Transcript_18264:257-1420(+)